MKSSTTAEKSGKSGVKSGSIAGQLVSKVKSVLVSYLTTFALGSSVGEVNQVLYLLYFMSVLFTKVSISLLKCLGNFWSINLCDV